MRGGPPPGGGSVNEGTGSHVTVCIGISRLLNVTGEYNGGITMPYFEQNKYISFIHLIMKNVVLRG